MPGGERTPILGVRVRGGLALRGGHRLLDLMDGGGPPLVHLRRSCETFGENGLFGDLQAIGTHLRALERVHDIMGIVMLPMAAEAED